MIFEVDVDRDVFGEVTLVGLKTRGMVSSRHVTNLDPNLCAVRLDSDS